MKIDAMSGYLPIRKTGVSASTKTPASQQTAKTDVVDFSRGQAAPPDKSILALRSSILHEAAKPADSQKLAALKQRIQDGSYHTDPKAIAKAIVSSED